MVVHSASCALSSPSSLQTDFWLYIFIGCCPICVSSIPEIVSLRRLGFFLCVFLFLLWGLIFRILFHVGLVRLSLKAILLLSGSDLPHFRSFGCSVDFSWPNCSLNDSSALVQFWTVAINSESKSIFS